MKNKILSLFAFVLLFSSILVGCGNDKKEKSYTVKFQTNGGTEVASITVKEGDLIDNSKISTTKNNYDFDGWYVNSNLTTPWDFESDVVKKNITLYAKWAAPKATMESTTETEITQTLSTDLLAKIENGDSFILFAGSTSCTTCMSFKPLLNQFVSEYGKKIYYFSAEETDSDDKNELKTALGGTVENGKVILMVPQLFAFVDGSLVGITGSSKEYSAVVTFISKYFKIN